MPRPMRNALLVLRVQTPAPTPHIASLAISSASASSLNVVTVRTEPTISSWKIRIWLCPLKTVGSKQKPPVRSPSADRDAGKTAVRCSRIFELGFQSSRGLLCRSPGRRN